MNRAELDRFEKLVGQLESVYAELSLLSKKSPNDAVNPFKLRFVNTLLGASAVTLGSGYMPFTDFEQFDSDNVPQNSDVVFILSQYLQCFEKLRADNVVYRNGTWDWEIDAVGAEGVGDSGKVYVRSTRPKRLRD
jgi:hypothetical protein